MPTTFPNAYTPPYFLNPRRGLGERADVWLTALHEHGFVAAAGLTEFHAGSLAIMATQPHIVEYCPNDTATRFYTPKINRVWNGKGGGRGVVVIYSVGGNDGESLTPADLATIREDGVHAVAWGWAGHETNKHILGADVTTAYRVGEEGQRLAFERRKNPEDKFKLGQPLGELVIATAVEFYHADPNKISLETWQSNRRAVALYEAMNFELRDTLADERPTLMPIGTEIDGNVVYLGEYKDKKSCMVRDARRFYKLGDAHPLMAAAA